jgi:hypothetical protein
VSERVEVETLGATPEMRRELAGTLRTIEASAIRLNELFRSFDSALVRHKPLCPAKAELVQSLTSRLRSRIATAANDLRLQRVLQDGSIEAASLLALIKERLRPLFSGSSEEPRSEAAQYVADLGEECTQIVYEIAAALGGSVRDAVVGGSGRAGGER